MIAAIWKIQYSHHRMLRKNVNIVFRIRYILKFKKMYRFATLQKNVNES